MQKISKFQQLKSRFSRSISNEFSGQIFVEFENILQEVSVLTQDLSGYEMIQSQHSLLNDWINNEILLSKGLSLDQLKIGNMVQQIQSTDISEKEK